MTEGGMPCEVLTGRGCAGAGGGRDEPAAKRASSGWRSPVDGPFGRPLNLHD